MAAISMGRPRDLGVDGRVHRAALDIYGEKGWSGFSIEAVARRAQVGKASIYLRWSAKADLLASAFEGVQTHFADIDEGSVRADLVELAMLSYAMNSGPHGDAMLRLTGEAHHIPELAIWWDRLRTEQVLAARSIVRRAIHRGELPAGTSVTLLLDAILGGVFMHALSSPRGTHVARPSDRPAYVEELVDLALAGVTSGAVGKPDRSSPAG
ncbi:MAG: TetR/AcrR family transcriptional regulator [Aeromicrobium sp.]